MTNRLALSLLLVGCTAKESSPPEYWRDKGVERISVLSPTDGKTVLRFRAYAGDIVTQVRVIPAEKCVLFSPTTWSCDEGRIVMDGDRLLIRTQPDGVMPTYDNPFIQKTYRRVRP